MKTKLYLKSTITDLKQNRESMAQLPHQKFTGAIIALLCLVAVVCAQKTGAEKNGTSLPPSDLNRVSVGSKAPDFTLEDSEGRPVTLAKYRGKKSVVLVFYRGYW